MSIQITTSTHTRDEAISEAVAAARTFYGDDAIIRLFECVPPPPTVDDPTWDSRNGSPRQHFGIGEKFSWRSYWSATLISSQEHADRLHANGDLVFYPVEPIEPAAAVLPNDEAFSPSALTQFTETLAPGECILDGTGVWREIEKVQHDEGDGDVGSAKIVVTFTAGTGSAWLHPDSTIQYLPRGFFGRPQP